MSDDLPNPERLDRIERGVQRRIDARRATARSVRNGVTGGLVVVLLIGGGFALLRPLSTGTSGASSGSAARAPASVSVECHRGTATSTVQADEARLPASALAACGAVPFGSAARPNDASGSSASESPSPTALPSVLCRTKGGDLHVYPGPAAVCAMHGMTAYSG